MLEEVFRIAGNVLSVELKMDKENKFRGMATVRFEHPMESVQAICILAGFCVM
jgi:RNA recognition motif. (a.k.a. RRM, RBD, or RNP domain)